MSAARLLASAGGTAGRMKSGNFGAVTTGAGTIFGAHALAKTSEASRRFRIIESLPAFARAQQTRASARQPAFAHARQTRASARAARVRSRVTDASFGARAARSLGATDRASMPPSPDQRVYAIEKTPWDVRHDRRLAVARFVQHDATVAIQAGDALAIGVVLGVERQGHAADVERQPRGDGLDQLVNALPGERRDAERRRGQVVQPAPLARCQRIALVVDLEERHVDRADLVEHLPDGVHAAIAIGSGRIDDVQHQVGVARLLERRPEGGDQRVRQPVDETDSVRDEELAAVRQAQLPHERIERDEERVGRLRVRPRQPIEQRRLSGVRVADERHGRHRRLVPPFAELRASLAYLRDVAGDPMNPRPDAPPVGLELRFAGSPRADAAAEPRQRGGRPDEPREKILQLRELDLQLAFARARAAREDVENQLCAIDDLAADLLLDLALLRGRQLVVEDHDVDAGFRGGCRERLDLAGAEERRRIGFRTLLEYAQHDLGPRRLCEAGQLVERALGFLPARAARDQPDERGTLRSPYAGRSVSSHACNSSQEIAPARTSAGAAEVTSTIVDGGPPRVGPVSINKSIRSPSVRSTSSGSGVAGSPLTFALVAVIGRPHAAQIARATSSAGTRTPTFPVPPVTSRARPRGAGTSSVSGPGQ